MIISKTNGSFRIEQSEIYTICPPHFAVVLAHSQASGMWATWETGGPNDFFFGHYFETEREARMDYHERLLTYYKYHD